MINLRFATVFLCTVGVLVTSHCGALAATPEQKCTAIKIAAGGTAVSGRTKCVQRALLKSLPVDPLCVSKVSLKLEGDFAKADALASCPGVASTTLSGVDACIAAFEGAIAGSAKCAATKIKAAGANSSSSAKCSQKATLAGTAIDPLCLTKTDTKLSTMVTKADLLGTCTGSAGAILALVDDCVASLAPPTTSTTTTTTTTLPPAASTVDFTADGYFTMPGRVFNAGMPSATYIPIPATLTHAELAQLQDDCINRINLYRDGTLRFSNGNADPGVPKPLLTHLMGNDVCSSAQALGDLFVNGAAGGCAGAHTTAFSCPLSGTAAQNSCCARPATTYTGVRSQLYSCLQQMWDEGIGLPDNAAFSLANGHWHSMRNANLRYAHCGFAFSANGLVWMNQDFSGNLPAGVPLVCSCVGQNIGDPDGCGGTCVADN